MADQDQVKPYHAKDTAPGKEAADVVAEVLQHAQAREAAAQKKTAPKGPAKWMLPLTVNLGVLALYFIIAQPEFVVMNPNVETRSTSERVDDIRGAMVVAAAQVDAFILRESRMPQSLVEVGSPYANAFTFTAVDDTTFILSATVDGEAINFDSANPDSFGTVNLGGG